VGECKGIRPLTFSVFEAFSFLLDDGLLPVLLNSPADLPGGFRLN
jgi:hypothetical protein